ncbi:hypothetical protein LX86_005065 [Lentzea aerocolonigenes]|nr:hypothetical protein [Lentzea aerocolonigenes]
MPYRSGCTPTMKCYKKSATSNDTNVSWSRLRYGITAVDIARSR